MVIVSVLQDSASNQVVTFDDLCKEYKKTYNIQGQLIKDTLGMSVIEFISKCDVQQQRARRNAQVLDDEAKQIF